MTSRIDGVVTFTLIRFTHQELRKHLDDLEIVFCSFWVAMFASVLLTICLHRESASPGNLLSTTQRIAILVGNQAAIATQSTASPVYPVDQILLITKLTGMLIVFFVASRLAQLPAYTEQSLTLLLYMYTEAMQNVIDRLNLRSSGAVLFAAIYLLLRSTWQGIDRQKSLSAYFGRALIMLSVNVALSELARSFADSRSQSVGLVFFIFLLDVIAHIYNGFEDARDFCIWRAAQTLFDLYNAQGIEVGASFAIGILLFFVKDVLIMYDLTSMSETWSSVVTLILVNLILSVAAPSEQLHSIEQLFRVFIYALLMHQVSISVAGFFADGR